MNKKENDQPVSPIMETPFGIFTPGGHWYFITREQIEEYTPGLLEKYGLEKLLKDAESWINSDAILSIFTFAILQLFSVDTYISFLAAIFVFVSWNTVKGAFLTKGTTYIIKVISHNAFIYLFTGVFLSYMGVRGFNLTVIIGIFLFFMVKLPLLKLALKRIKRMVFRDGMVEEEDRIFNMILIKYALHEGQLTENVKQMEQRLFELIHYNRKKRK